MFNTKKNKNLKAEILGLASNEISGKKISIEIINSMKKGKSPEIILSNGKKLVLKRITDLMIKTSLK